jgi:maleate isomerase
MSLNLAATPLTSSGPIDLGVLPSELDAGLASRAAIGLLVLATDQTMEHEFRALVRQPGVAFYESRVFSDNDITPETLRAIGPRIAPSVDLILPSIPLDVVAFGCTSATMTLGEEAVFAEIHKVRPNVACTTPVTAALAAFQALDAKSIGLLTPYAPQINGNLVSYFGRRGVNIAAVATFDRRDDRDAARISVASIEAAAEQLAATPGVDAIFVSCTSLRVSEAIARLEQRNSVPITSSNHAMAWHCLRLAGVDDVLPAAGRLFQRQCQSNGRPPAGSVVCPNPSAD